jgi:hypothetical protein
MARLFHPRAMNEDAYRRAAAGLDPAAVDELVRLPGADLTTVLLEIMRRRAAAIEPAEVLRRYTSNRFVRPGVVDAQAMRGAEGALFASLPSSFEQLVLSPLAPFGTHAMAGVDQSRVVSTARATEVAADPTNALALEAAVRRRSLLAADSRSARQVRLAASQRIVRAQRFESADAFTHFKIFGLVTAGRDAGDLAFECDAVVEHLRFYADAVTQAGGDRVIVALTDLAGDRMNRVADAVRGALGKEDGIEVRDDPDREGGRVYYNGLCFKVFAWRGDKPFELADGGLVDWTQRLVPSRKERLLISGLGIERLAMLLDSS